MSRPALDERLTDDELIFGLILIDPLLFAQFFWPDELKLEPSKNQKLMIQDRNPHRIVCTGRKVWKCVTSDTVLTDPRTGEQRTVADLAQDQSGFSIQTLENWQLHPTTEFTIRPNGVVETFRVSTRSGRYLDVSGNHPFLTGNGWVPCSLLQPGDLVGVTDATINAIPQSLGLLLVYGGSLDPSKIVDSAGIDGSLTRETIREVADSLHNDTLHAVADSSVGWDEVTSITSLGPRETYDLTVPGTQNFVAQEFITHNTGNIERFIIQTALTTTGDPKEGMFVTPQEAQLNPTVDRMLSRIRREPLFASLLQSANRGSNGYLVFPRYKWEFRIEGTSNDGRRMIGLRASHIVGDEMAYGNWPAFLERLSTALPGAEVMYCGVPNGVRGTPFFELDQTRRGKDWSRHHMTSFDNPIYQTPAGIKKLRLDYGSDVTRWEWVTQVLGQWGQAQEGVFSRDQIATQENGFYRVLNLNWKQFEEVTDVSVLLPLPAPGNVQDTIIGIDAAAGGADPWVIKVFVRLRGLDYFADYCRIMLTRVGDAIYVARLLRALNDKLHGTIRKVGYDDNNYGRALPQVFFGPAMHHEVAGPYDWESILVPAVFGGRSSLEGARAKETSEGTLGNRHLYTMWLRKELQTPRVYLERTDDQQLDELLTLRSVRTTSGHVVYIAGSRNEDHITDALRAAAKAFNVWDREQNPDTETDLSELGWIETDLAMPKSVPWEPKGYIELASRDYSVH